MTDSVVVPGLSNTKLIDLFGVWDTTGMNPASRKTSEMTRAVSTELCPRTSLNANASTSGREGVVEWQPVPTNEVKATNKAPKTSGLRYLIITPFNSESGWKSIECAVPGL